LDAINGLLEYSDFIGKHSHALQVDYRWQLFEYVNEQINNTAVTFLEFGVYKGKSINLWASINTNPNSRFIGFDTFEGLPETWHRLINKYEKGKFDMKGVIPEIVDSRISFIKGYFQESLPAFFCNDTYALTSKQLIVHFDADLYSSELFCLCQLYPYMSKNTIMIFDDFYIVEHDFRALRDFTSSHLIRYEVMCFASTFKQVAIKITGKG
jgi:hypothetical protein